MQSGEGIGNEFIYIIAAVVGGCLLTGGYGSAVGASFGALMFGMTQLGINYAGWNPDWFKTFLGVMLLAAVLLNTYVKRKADARCSASRPVTTAAAARAQREGRARVTLLARRSR